MASEATILAEKTVSTDKQINALKYAGEPVTYSVVDADGKPLDGLRLRVGASKKVFIAKATINGKRRNLTLGNFIKKKVGVAPFEIYQAVTELKARKNPDYKAAPTQSDYTLIQMYKGVDSFEDELVGFHQSEIADLSSAHAVEQVFNFHILPTLGAMKVANISHRQLTNLLAKIEGVEARRKVYIYLKKFFAWAAPKANLEMNPALALEAKTYAVKTKPRERCLTREEVVQFHAAVAASQMNVRTKLGFKLLLLLGVRSGELRKAEWKHVNRKTQQWLIPASNSKTGEALVVALPTQAVELFTHLKKETGDTGLVMGNFSEKAFTKALNRIQTKNKKDFCLLPFEQKITPHDLRRSASTFCYDLGIDACVVEKMLNHSQPQMAAVYNRSDFWELRMEAAQKYADALETPLESFPERAGEFTEEAEGFVSE